MNWHEREDGMIEFRARIPKDEGALVIAAIRTAKDQFGPPPAKRDPCGDARQEATGVGSTAMSMACWMWPAASFSDVFLPGWPGSIQLAGHGSAALDTYRSR